MPCKNARTHTLLPHRLWRIISVGVREKSVWECFCTLTLPNFHTLFSHTPTQKNHTKTYVHVTCDIGLSPGCFSLPAFLIETISYDIIMPKTQIRTRPSRISDIHILYCDCSQCDGIGELIDPLSLRATECPACEGLGHLEPISQKAYNAYLSDLYSEVVKEMPRAKNVAVRLGSLQSTLNSAA